MKNKNLCRHYHNRTEHPRCFEKREMLEIPPPKPVAILIFDIETLPILAYTWGAYEQNLQIDGIVKDWAILSWSAKWLGDDKIISDIMSSKEALERDDRRLLKDFWKLLDRADVVITHNGRQFDIKKVNTRLMYHGIKPPSSYKNIDTLAAARSVFGMTMNKQDYIAKYLGIQRKLHTDFQLWVDCDNGKKFALKKMRNYNSTDVLMLEEIYLRIRAWIPGHPHLETIAQIDACPICLGEYKKSGIYYANKKRYTEYRCSNPDCGAVFHSTKSIR